ncbi:hypothetical protein SLEP1_g40812 [Rubroshorea leprosula]|uniref:Uncharacterized protein n=1 Tax=Rubroshorea leprosula TaxID=152421 RepID=A0AAV5L4Q8_9ROSI|nr:hypothetical protein SLEP1_g40812 [Rubroshorea leprosula]
MDDVEQLFQCFNASSAASLLPVGLSLFILFLCI